MYIRADDWKSAYRVAIGHMPAEEIRELYMAQVGLLTICHSLPLVLSLLLPQAGQLEKENRLSEAEQLYLLIHEPDMAITMYKKAKQVRLKLIFTATLNSHPFPVDSTIQWFDW